jgi:hypothetical protein
MNELQAFKCREVQVSVSCTPTTKCESHISRELPALILWRARCRPEGSTEEERIALAMDTHTTMEGTVVSYGVCSEATMVWSQEVFSVESVPRLFNSDTREIYVLVVASVAQLAARKAHKCSRFIDLANKVYLVKGKCKVACLPECHSMKAHWSEGWSSVSCY